MIDVSTETLLDPRAAVREPVFQNPRTRRPSHLSKFYRAIHAGCRAVDGRRVRLEFVQVPGDVRTSREAIVRWIAELTCPTSAPTFTSPAQQQQHHARAEKELAAAGI